MNFDSIFFYIIGCLSLIAVALGKDWSFGMWLKTNYKPSKKAKIVWNIVMGLFCLAIGRALSRPH